MSGAVGIERPQAPFGRRPAAVSARSDHGPYVSLSVRDSVGPRPLAGQFYMLQTAADWGGGDDGRPYLPRALSFARVEQEGDALLLDFLLEDVGPGTHRITELDVSDELLIAGPFGNGFDLNAASWPVLVAGGIGLAPIVALDDEIRDLDGVRAATFVGMRTNEHAEAVAHYGLEHELATEDGSGGVRGYVTELLGPLLSVDSAGSTNGAGHTVYACGPPAMLEAIRSLCTEHEVACQLAMESGMACGFGACFGCVVPTHDGYTRLCVDGPVLDAGKLDTALVAGAGH
ncbi:MAG: hypothetical protein ACPHCI_00560 [Solirubrobacterales bacterium]